MIIKENADAFSQSLHCFWWSSVKILCLIQQGINFYPVPSMVGSYGCHNKLSHFKWLHSTNLLPHNSGDWNSKIKAKSTKSVSFFPEYLGRIHCIASSSFWWFLATSFNLCLSLNHLSLCVFTSPYLSLAKTLVIGFQDPPRSK